MQTPNCCLMIVFPHSLYEKIVDFMLQHQSLTRGFVCVQVNGHGPNAVYQTMAEQVRGTVREMQLQTVLHEADAKIVLDDLKIELSNANITYWLTPLISYGSLT